MKSLFIGLALLLASAAAHASISKLAWGGVGGQGVDLYTLTNAKGMQVQITNYGGIIVSVRVPDRTGKLADVVQGFGSLADYTSPQYGGRYGAIIGRFANRIKNNSYVVDGLAYHVDRNAFIPDPSENKPYDQRVWKAQIENDGAEPSLALSLLDRNGTMGFPGNLHVTVTYTLTRDNTLRLDYRAVSDRDTIISLTNHSYFNMAGDQSGSVLNQLLTINADAITPGDQKNVPTGEIRPVAGSAFDFRRPTPIGAHIQDPDPLLTQAKGYDQNFVINGTPGTLRLAARLEDPVSGRVLAEWTTQAGLQVYTANYMPPPVALAKGYGQHSAIALETQGFPNAPNIASFPSVRLAADQEYRQVTEYRFSVDFAKQRTAN